MTIPQAGIMAVAILWLLAVGAGVAKLFGLLASLSWGWVLAGAAPVMLLFVAILLITAAERLLAPRS
jgi:hypothetical protein